MRSWTSGDSRKPRKSLLLLACLLALSACAGPIFIDQGPDWAWVPCGPYGLYVCGPVWVGDTGPPPLIPWRSVQREIRDWQGYHRWLWERTRIYGVGSHWPPTPSRSRR